MTIDFQGISANDMNRSARLLAVTLLTLNGIGAIYGGGALMIDATGAKLQLSLQLLENTPFKDYFIPGMVLFWVNGIMSMLIAVLSILRVDRYERFIVIQGSVLIAWILIQIFMLKVVDPLHFILCVMGLTMVVLGLILASNSESGGIKGNYRGGFG